MSKQKDSVLDYLQHPSPAIGFLMTQLKQAQLERRPLTEEWSALKAFYERQACWKDVLHLVEKPPTRRMKGAVSTRGCNRIIWGKLFGECFAD